ncbi:unnamed protein product [Hymenolepis diminuta]|uniref:glutaminyl-peptide cyclotransferase n=1 Tax=Hymenolepis diminuta TaxID=6216 RepID=A0A3P6XVV0_HYMDI|nr:unnamed protein product [Hymenolepis diminuta]
MSMKNFDEILRNINLIRPVGSENLTNVREYIVNSLENIDWKVELDTFTDLTVIGYKSFSNIIAINNPGATRRLVLACHYDSKLMHGFYGTIDSAVPCAIMVNIANSLSKIFDSSQSGIALQLIFFDGEEAFKEWTDTDSTYGSRHLAAKMSTSDSHGCSDIQRMDLFILLDLIGAAGYPFPHYPHCDSRYYDILHNLELISSPFFLPRSEGLGASPFSSYFSSDFYDGIQDDHIPFLNRGKTKPKFILFNLGVPVLHLIPAPFPPQWHRLTDTIDNIDRKAIHDIQLLVAGFLCQYLQVSPSKVDHVLS